MSYFFKSLAAISELFVDKSVSTLEGVILLDYHFINNILNEVDKHEISNTFNELIQFNLDISYVMAGYINLSEYDKKYSNCFNPNVLSKLSEKYFNNLLETKKDFYVEYFSDVIKKYEQLKKDG